MSATVAALYVMPDGPYAGLPDVEVWDEARDARCYDGPHVVVVAHPPCQRWGRYWFGGPSARVRKTLGDDGGCFAAALASVRRWGGVLEHPEASHAWGTHGLPAPAKSGGWEPDLYGGWSCCVEQGHYGHRARKATWLYFVGEAPPAPLIWGPAPTGLRLDEGFHSAAERASASVERLGKRERLETPLPFRNTLLALARSARSVPA